MSERRLGRWLLPAAVVSLAGGAIAFLGALELDDEPARLAQDVAGGAPVPEGGAVLAVELAPAGVAPSGAAASHPAALGGHASAPERGSGPGAGRAPADARSPRGENPSPAAPPRAQAFPRPATRAATLERRAWSAPGGAGHVRETPQVVAASRYVSELAQVGSQRERLDLIAALPERLPEGDAVTALEGLLDAALPGDRYEVEDQRLAALARLGELRGDPAGAALLRRLEPDCPRPQRLVAVDYLVARAEPGIDAGLETVARADPDAQVREHARWALSRRR